MLTGIPPFYCKDREKLFDSIKTKEVQYPEYLSEEVIDLMKKLDEYKGIAYDYQDEMDLFM